MLNVCLSADFSKQVKHKGKCYYLRGDVHVVRGNELSVVATVRGDSDCTVRLLRSGDKIEADCGCANFRANTAPCKHIWAALLAAEERGYLQTADGAMPLKVEAVSLADALVDDIADDDLPAGYAKQWEGPLVAPSAAGRERKAKPGAADWKRKLSVLQQASRKEPDHYSQRSWPPGREIVYVIDVLASTGDVRLETAYRERKRDGDWSKLKSEGVNREQIPRLPDIGDQRVLSVLSGPSGSASKYGIYYAYLPTSSRFDLSRHQVEAMMPLLAQTGRCYYRLGEDKDDIAPLRWDTGMPWEFFIQVDFEADKGRYVLRGCLRRGEERMPLAQPVLLAPAGLLIADGVAAFFRDYGNHEMLLRLRKSGPIFIPATARDELAEELARRAHLVPFELPVELRFEQVTGTPAPKLKVLAPKQNHYYGTQRLQGQLSFVYEHRAVPHLDSEPGFYDKERRRLVLRDRDAEGAALARLHQLGFRTPAYTHDLELAPRNLPHVVKALLAEGWQVEAEGKLYRKPGSFQIEVKSGIDWFELHGTVEFGDRRAHLPELLAAVKRGENIVRLDDGSFGMVPEEWLKKYGMLAGLGTADENHLRFSRCQVGLLDALLAAQPEATCDNTFAKARDELRRFDGIKPALPPAGFNGELRPYQCEGLGWFDFLERFNFGGCLADDMGLGKTVQVLALLEARRLRRDSTNGRKAKSAPAAPALVVVPRSLVFNWKQEAARFTPELRILDHTGMGRAQDAAGFKDYDIVLTTYGTLRRDLLLFKDFAFDYCILDEAQAIKNANSESAKAARLLQGRQRLALSGTPVENHLGELWSLFEFLNPGMLGSASVFRLSGSAARNPDEETRKLLAQALRPFILRRTKDQVCTELPAKLEQTLYCELEGEQRRQYDELRNFYREQLLGDVDRHGIKKVQMQVLSALLRLRQAACHPGLIDRTKTTEPAAKLDLLLPQIAEVIDEGHKVLVFSQFTSFLAIVRERLDKEGIRYEYLDGKTRDRAARVEAFQNDAECKLFLISLKAGGLGLNLTAAEYVFLLDPWWNPAVEAQAIDRAHRIGQSRRVFAYRLIARDTVEEKVLKLQESKRALADAIISADNSLIRNLGREDLELLLS